MIELTHEICDALSTHPNEPIELLDPTTKQTYVLVRSEVFQRVKDLLADDFDPNIGAALMNQIMAEDDANDPYLESYQNY